MPETNNQFLVNNFKFRKHCKECGLTPSKRQASKYRRGKGAAYRTGVLKRKDVHIGKVS